MVEFIKQLINFMQRPEIFPFLLIGGWVLISYSFAQQCGWSKLKTKYQHTGNLHGITFHTGSGNIGGSNITGALKVGTTNDGLVLKSHFLFRIGHPPLLFPWSSISVFKVSDEILSQDNFMNLKLTEPIKKKAFYTKYAEVTLIEFPDFKITIPWHGTLNQHLPDSFLLKSV